MSFFVFVEISEPADQDLQEIFDYAHVMHGMEQAVRYVSSFDEIFDALAKHPEIGRERSEITEGLRSMVKDFHIVFYRVLSDRIRIVRIIHSSRDLRQQVF